MVMPKNPRGRKNATVWHRDTADVGPPRARCAALAAPQRRAQCTDASRDSNPAPHASCMRRGGRRSIGNP